MIEGTFIAMPGIFGGISTIRCRMGYVRYVFSFDSKLPEFAGKRAGFEGVSICEMQNGKLTSYREVANSLVGLQALGFAPERLAKLAARGGGLFRATRGRASSRLKPC